MHWTHWVSNLAIPDTRRIIMGLDTAARGMGICADTNQYIVCTHMHSNYKRRPIYDTTNNDLRMHVNGTDSLVLNSSSLTGSTIACAGIGKPTAATVTSIYMVWTQLLQVEL